MTNHYRPSHSTEQDIFRVPRDQRPFIDLSLVPQTADLPIHLRKLNSAATRWGNLVIGFSLDPTTQNPEHVTPPKDIRAAFEKNLISFSMVVETTRGELGEDAVKHYFGSVSMYPDYTVTVVGGNSAKDSSVTFTRGPDGVLVPTESIVQREGLLVKFPEPFLPAVQDTPKDLIPNEFLAAQDFGRLEQDLTSYFERFGAIGVNSYISMKNAVTLIRPIGPGGLRGPGSM